MTPALEGDEWSAVRPGRTLPPWKTRYPFYRRLGGPQGRSGRAENLVPTGIRSWTVQPVVSRYTGWATGQVNKYIYIYIYILNYLLILWRRVLLEKLTGLQLVKKFPPFQRTRMFITALIRVRQLSLSWASPIQCIYPHPTSWRSILILSTHLRLGLPSDLLPSGFPTNTLYTPLPSPIRAKCPRQTTKWMKLPKLLSEKLFKCI